MKLKVRNSQNIFQGYAISEWLKQGKAPCC